MGSRFEGLPRRRRDRQHDGDLGWLLSPGGRWKTDDDATIDVFIGDRDKDYPKPDGKTIFDKPLVRLRERQRHARRRPEPHPHPGAGPFEIALMWQNMCPAAVYEVPDEELEAARADGNSKLDGKHEVKLQITPSNCIQCGAITAKGGRLTPPEGGDGPNYQVT